MPKKLWLSYSWKDNVDKDVDFIASEITKKGIEVRLDRFILTAGQRLWTQIEAQIVNQNVSDAWSILMTQNSLTSEAVLEEISYAVDRAITSRGKNYPVIGINPGNVELDVIPASLKTRIYVDLTDEDWVERIAAAVEGRDLDIDRKVVLPVFFGESFVDGIKVIEVRPRAGRWSPAFIAVPENEYDLITSVMQAPSGHPTLDGMINRGTLEFENLDGHWKGVVVYANITTINSIYFGVKSNVSKVLAGNVDGQKIGVSYIYVPKN